MNQTRDLYMAERRQEILRRLHHAGRVSVVELSQAFDVSEVTIRTDLQALAEQNLVIRTHGGAILASDDAPDLALSSRQEQQMQEKGHIGQAAAQMVEEAEAIYLDSSSTALAIAQHLPEGRSITVITSSLAVAQTLQETVGITIVMPGGVVQNDTASLIGADGLAYLSKFNIQKGFFGSHGIAIREGLTDISVDISAAKQPIVGMCRQVIAVVDATKWDRVGLASFASINEINTVITDEHAPPNWSNKSGHWGWRWCWYRILWYPILNIHHCY